MGNDTLPATDPAVRLRGHLEDMERAVENVALLLAETRETPLLPPETILLLWRSKAAASQALHQLPVNPV